MWQRIQTVFLGITILVLIISLVQPVWIYTPEDGGEILLTPFYFMQDQAYQYIPFCVTAVLSIAAATIAITSIRKFKNRMLQMKLGALNSLILVGVVGTSVYFAVNLLQEFHGGHYGMGMYLPVVAVIANLVANFFIRRDEKLVRDSDRLR